MMLSGFSKLIATVKLKNGLHIGTGEKGGGRGDSTPVMTSLSSGLPYVPGSSLKGKMRHMLEITFGRAEKKDNGSPCCCGKCQICLLFGSGSADKTFEPSRLIFRDSFPTEDTEKFLEKFGLEKKPGVRIDRETGKAAGKALFPMDRVPEDCEFDMEVSIRVFDGDNLDSIKKWLAMGLYLMEQDALGGGGTRGSGQIEFNNIKFNNEAFAETWRQDCIDKKDEIKAMAIKP